MGGERRMANEISEPDYEKIAESITTKMFKKYSVPKEGYEPKVWGIEKEDIYAQALLETVLIHKGLKETNKEKEIAYYIKFGFYKTEKWVMKETAEYHLKKTLTSYANLTGSLTPPKMATRKLIDRVLKEYFATNEVEERYETIIENFYLFPALTQERIKTTLLKETMTKSEEVFLSKKIGMILQNYNLRSY